MERVPPPLWGMCGGVRGRPHAPGPGGPAFPGPRCQPEMVSRQLCRGPDAPGPIYILWSGFARAKMGWGQCLQVHRTCGQGLGFPTWDSLDPILGVAVCMYLVWQLPRGRQSEARCPASPGLDTLPPALCIRVLRGPAPAPTGPYEPDSHSTWSPATILLTDLWGFEQCRLNASGPEPCSVHRLLPSKAGLALHTQRGGPRPWPG